MPIAAKPTNPITDAANHSESIPSPPQQQNHPKYDHAPFADPLSTQITGRSNSIGSQSNPTPAKPLEPIHEAALQDPIHRQDPSPIPINMSQSANSLIAVRLICRSNLNHTPATEQPTRPQFEASQPAIAPSPPSLSKTLRNPG